ncbi:hypothetical protein JX266_008535, partial [Neoarthrinium moseri]
TTVYGITNYTDAKGNKASTVSSLSPVYNPIDATTTSVADPGDYNAIAAASDGETTDYVYFLQDPEGVSQKPLITEYGFQQSTMGTRYVYTGLNPDPSSNLAAVIEKSKGTRMMIFQNYKDATLYYAWSNTKSKNPITGSNNAVLGTPLAATLIPFPDSTFEVYLYYVDNTQQLWRVIYTGTQPVGGWGSPTAVGAVTDVDPSSGLAVVSDKTGNYIFFKANPNRYNYYHDSFKQPILGEDDANDGHNEGVERGCN